MACSNSQGAFLHFSLAQPTAFLSAVNMLCCSHGAAVAYPFHLNVLVWVLSWNCNPFCLLWSVVECLRIFCFLVLGSSCNCCTCSVGTAVYFVQEFVCLQQSCVGSGCALQSSCATLSRFCWFYAGCGLCVAHSVKLQLLGAAVDVLGFVGPFLV
ncbi:hypothetical protein U1Q18_029077 [Sarracenia purpurea var. burkii]